MKNMQRKDGRAETSASMAQGSQEHGFRRMADGSGGGEHWKYS